MRRVHVTAVIGIQRRRIECADRRCSATHEKSIGRQRGDAFTDELRVAIF